MQLYDVNESNFLLLAVKHYDSPNCIMSEFETDLKRIKYIKRLIKKYKNAGDLKERLILNHIIVLANVFGVDFAVKMLFYKLDITYYSILKTFLVYLKYMPERVMTINGNTIISSDIYMDEGIITRLRKN